MCWKHQNQIEMKVLRRNLDQAIFKLKKLKTAGVKNISWKTFIKAKGASIFLNFYS